MKVGMKNAIELMDTTSALYDFALNEECFAYDECDVSLQKVFSLGHFFSTPSFSVVSCLSNGHDALSSPFYCVCVSLFLLCRAPFAVPADDVVESGAPEIRFTVVVSRCFWVVYSCLRFGVTQKYMAAVQ